VDAFALTTERMILDQPTSDDIDEITEYCQDPVFEKFLTLPWPYKRSHARYFVEQYVPKGWANGTELTWALRSRQNDGFLGTVSLRLPAADIGFWIGAPHRDKGLMTEALRSVTDWVFGTGFAGIRELKWECVAGNQASASVARKAGFTFTGIGPAEVPARDGSLPESWHGMLRADDTHTAKPGWPL
jgi:RimJ/RimL family protein N-acetyltransferase